MKKVKSVKVSFLALGPPTKFASARHAGEHFHHPLVVIARERAEQFFGEVSECGELLTFARTFFEQET